MKINFQFVTVLSAGINIAVANCNTNDLTQPDHFKAWNCVQPTPISGIVPYGTKCYLECEDGYTPFSSRAKNHYTCRKSGWRPPSLDLECKYDPDYWIPKLLDDVKANAENIDVNRGDIADTDDKLQAYFKGIMNFDAIKHIKRVSIDEYLVNPAGPWPIIVDINGNEGYACDTDGTVDQHTADLLCIKAGNFTGGSSLYAGAVTWFTQAPNANPGPSTPPTLPLTVGEMYCPPTAKTLSEFHSSGWGDFRNECDYENVLWLGCRYASV